MSIDKVFSDDDRGASFVSHGKFHTLQLQREERLLFYIIVTFSLPKRNLEYYLARGV